MTNGETKLVLRCARSQEQFDNIMGETYCRNDSERIIYLQQLFGINAPDAKNRHEQYILLAKEIMTPV